MKLDKLKELKNDYMRNKEIKVMLEEGVSLNNIADKYGVSIGLPNYLKTNYEGVQKNIEERIAKYERVVGLFRKGMNINQIADLDKTTKQNISRILKMAGVTRDEGGTSKSKSDIVERVVDLHERGYTLEDMSAELNVDEVRIRQYSYEAGIDVESASFRRVRRLRRDVVKLRKKGMSQAEIAENLEISQAYVSSILISKDFRSKLHPDEYSKRDERIYEDFKEGLKVKNLCEKYDLNDLNVRRILHKFIE